MLHNKKQLNANERLMSELILLGGEILSRREALQQLQFEEVPRGAIDWAVFAAPALTQEDLLRFARNSLLLQLRCRIHELTAEENRP